MNLRGSIRPRCELVPWEGCVCASWIFLGAVCWLHTKLSVCRIPGCKLSHWVNKLSQWVKCFVWLQFCNWSWEQTLFTFGQENFWYSRKCSLEYKSKEMFGALIYGMHLLTLIQKLYYLHITTHQYNITISAWRYLYLYPPSKKRGILLCICRSVRWPVSRCVNKPCPINN